MSICGYGQTGSGKTYTILGNDENPGIAPRTFCEIFSLANEMSQTYETVVSFYILELYNDKLIDLLNPVAINNNSALSTENQEPSKLEIRRDRRGTVWVSGRFLNTFCEDNQEISLKLLVLLVQKPYVDFSNIFPLFRSNIR